MSELTVGGIISNGFRIGLRNLVPVSGALVLWLATLWIPYLNVGTTIGLSCGLVIAVSRGETITSTEIFKPEYRKYMGEYFLLSAIIGLGVYAGLAFMIIPGIVIFVAWSQAIQILVDKGLSPMECIAESNRLTYGKKWTIVLGMAILKFFLFTAVIILSFVLHTVSDSAAIAVGGFGFLLSISIILGAAGYIYGVLTCQSEAGATWSFEE